MTYAPILLALLTLLGVSILSCSVWFEGTSADQEPYSIGLIFGALTAFAVLTLLGGIG